MIASVVNSISQEPTRVKPCQYCSHQPTNNVAHFTKQFSFLGIHFTTRNCWCCYCMGLWSDLEVLMSMVMPKAAIDSSKFSLWTSWLSISSPNLQEKIDFILIIWQQLWQWLSSNSSSDNWSDSGWALISTLTVAFTSAELWQYLWWQLSSDSSCTALSVTSMRRTVTHQSTLALSA